MTVVARRTAGTAVKPTMRNAAEASLPLAPRHSGTRPRCRTRIRRSDFNHRKVTGHAKGMFSARRLVLLRDDPRRPLPVHDGPEPLRHRLAGRCLVNSRALHRLKVRRDRVTARDSSPSRRALLFRGSWLWHAPHRWGRATAILREASGPHEALRSSAATQAPARSRLGVSEPGTVAQPACIRASRRW